MKRKRYIRSFATRLSQWVMLVMLIMMGLLSYLLFFFSAAMIVETTAESFHGHMKSTGTHISKMMTEITVAVDNNIFDIEDRLSEPDQMQSIMKRIVTQNPHIRSCGISFVKNYYPQKGTHFCPYAWRDDSMQVRQQLLNDSFQDYLQASWFIDAVDKDSAYWSKPFLGGFNANSPLVAYLHPIHDKQGKVVAILGADLSLDFMGKLLQEQDSIFETEVFALVIDGRSFQSNILLRDGTYLTHPEERRILKGNLYGHIKDYDEPGLAEKAIKEMSEGHKSSDEASKELMINRKTSYLFYSPVTGTDWVLGTVVTSFTLDFFGIFIGVALIFIVAFIVLVTYFVCRFVIMRGAKPLKLLADSADRVANGDFNTPLPKLKHVDEISRLRDSFENMQHSLTSYIAELKSTTAAKASIENELKIANNIQMSMLPKTYPAYPDRTDFDIYGQVTPAKAVGGDLYDFVLHNDKLYFCIGDVSGKGVPASLFMAVTRFLFRNILVHAPEPNHIVAGINEALCDHNESNMFVTLFVGILDLKTGCLHYCNAGHDMPLLISDGEVVVMSCDPNIPTGYIAEWSFTNQQIDLKPGTTIFLYTDGLNEAENISHQQFGLDRIIQIAASATEHPKKVIDTMAAAVSQFVGEAEQSDDLTMFAIYYNSEHTTH